MKVAIYTRVSTNHQSVEAQETELREVCERNGWEISAEYTDHAISGAKGRDQRPGLDQLMKAAIRREFDMVVVWSLDRFGRSLSHLVALLDDLQAKSVGFYAHKQGIDTNTPSGRMMLQIAGVFSEYERSLIKDRVVAGLEKAKRNGVKLGRPKIAQDLIDRIIQLRSDGLGMTKIAKTLGVGGGTVNRICKEMGV